MTATRPTQGWLGPLLLRLHFYAAILVGPFLLISAASGALYALSPQLEKVVYAHELTAPSDAASLPLAAQVEAAQEHVGEDAQLAAVRPAPQPGDTTRVMSRREPGTRRASPAPPRPCRRRWSWPGSSAPAASCCCATPAPAPAPTAEPGTTRPHRVAEGV